MTDALRQPTPATPTDDECEAQLKQMLAGLSEAELQELADMAEQMHQGDGTDVPLQ